MDLEEGDRVALGSLTRGRWHGGQWFRNIRMAWYVGSPRLLTTWKVVWTYVIDYLCIIRKIFEIWEDWEIWET